MFYFEREFENEIASRRNKNEVVTGWRSEQEETLVIPSEHNGKPVTEIRDLDFNRCDRDCKVKTIIIPNTVKKIADHAFSNCKTLEEIHIPASVETIGIGFAMNCDSLVKITVDPKNKFYDSRNDCNAVIRTKTNTLIQGCCNTIIPDGVKVIGPSAFQGCGSSDNPLKFIAIPDSVTKLDENAFHGCWDLESIFIPSSVREIGEYAFFGCSDLTALHLPDSIKKIGTHAFEGCEKLYYLRIPPKAIIADEAFFWGISERMIISTDSSKAEELVQRFPDYMNDAIFAIDNGGKVYFLDMKGVEREIKQQKEIVEPMIQMLEEYKKNKKKESRS